jgi:hypothetical protein
LKIIFAEKCGGKIGGFLAKIFGIYTKNDHSIGFQEKRQCLSQKIVKNC